MEDLGYEVFKLSTGKMFYPEAARVFIYEIQEGERYKNIRYRTEGDYMYEVSKGHSNAEDLTKDEAKEVAEHMVKIWTEFANSLK